MDHTSAAVTFLFLLSDVLAFAYQRRILLDSNITGRKMTTFSISRGASRSAYPRCAPEQRPRSMYGSRWSSLVEISSGVGSDKTSAESTGAEGFG